MPRAALLAVAVAALWATGIAPASAVQPAAGIAATLRAGGNRKDVATRIGQSLFATVWPAQLIKVRVDGAGTHDVAGLVISGVKFHARLDAAAFTREVVAIVRQTFAASDVEEVDVWATVPLVVPTHQVVGGDLAQPTTRIVYGATVLRGELPTFGARLQRGDDVFWDPAWRAALGLTEPAPAASGKG
ncbi:MAG: hypothetical protein IAI50_19290 [Candidatus Eremiobacteraeota bacterium]|nr:hypothetical protein [Candidatus Eremiobacteraeota bacterium]